MPGSVKPEAKLNCEENNNLHGNLLSYVDSWLWPVTAVVTIGIIAYVAGQGNLVTDFAVEYYIRAVSVGLVMLGAIGYVAAQKGKYRLGYIMVPAVAGAISAMVLASALSGTPFPPGGLGGDQTFRTAAVTRFSETWLLKDSVVEGLPSFYPPAFFWVTGRISALTGLSPIVMLKIAGIATAGVVPMLAYVMWRRVVSQPVAALVSVAALFINQLYQPYSWLVLAVFIPWWAESVGYLGRRHSNGSAIGLGLVGALMLMTYWYMFSIGLIAALIWWLLNRSYGTPTQHLWAAKIFAVVVVASAVYWLPLAVSIIQAEAPESLGNRWFNGGHPDLPLPMFEVGVLGSISLLGFVWMVYKFRDEIIARLLSVMLLTGYLWYALGAIAVAFDRPLLSFRGKPVVALTLLIAGIMAMIAGGRFILNVSPLWRHGKR